VLWSIGMVLPLPVRFPQQISTIRDSTNQLSKHSRFLTSRIISADAAYDAREIRQYNRERRIRSNILVNRRARKYPKRGRPFWFDPELYKKCSAVERFFSWIETFKEVVPRYERWILIPGTHLPGMCNDALESYGMASSKQVNPPRSNEFG